MTSTKTGFLHIPRTGGTYLEALLQHIGPKRFVNFFGTPDNQIHNRISLIEQISKNSQSQTKLQKILSADEVQIFSGHFSLNISEFLPNNYQYKYFTILRNPIDRTISFIKKVTSSRGFVSYMTSDCSFNDQKFWYNFQQYIDKKLNYGLMTHEIHGFSNYMTKALAGIDLSVSDANVGDTEYQTALLNTKNMCYVGDFKYYKETVQHILNMFDIRVNAHIRNPNDHTNNIPNNIIKLITDLNSYDLKLYRYYFNE
jgi:hypothetical protein